MIFKSAKSPPEPFPTHRPTNPFVRSQEGVGRSVGGERLTRLFCIADEDAHLGAGDDNAHMEPGIGVRRGTHGLFEDPRTFGSQLLPRIRGLRYVLYGVGVSREVVRPEVERAEVDSVVRRCIHPMKRNTDEALSLYVLASDVH